MSRYILLAAVICLSVPDAGIGKPAAHKSMAVPRPACLNGGRMVSHVAFTKSLLPSAKSCGQLLSTDTLVAIRRWDRT